MNKRGLANSIIAFTIIIFVFGITSLVSLTMWNIVNAEIQSIDNDTIAPNVKAKIDSLSSYMLWGDKLFITIFVGLFIAYLISSVSLPADKSIMLFMYIIYLIFISIFAMVISNGWEFITQNPNFVTAAQSLKFTDFFLKYLPIITFFIGIIGGVLFHAKNKDDISINKGGDPFGE